MGMLGRVNVQSLNEVLPLLSFVKMGTAILMVVLLSVLAEAVSPRFAGILSGYPLGAAISLFFIGYEISPQFAAESALYTSVGLIGAQVFAYCYYRTSLLANTLKPIPQVLCSSLGGILGYFVAVTLLRPLRVNAVLALILPSFFILLFIYLFRGVGNTKIHKKTAIRPKVLLIRSVFAALAVALITSTADIVGPDWAGLFAAFPVTMLPFVVIVHFSHAPEHAHTVLKNFPKGLGSLVVYTLAIFAGYPIYGIYAGTAIGYGLATIYLLATQLQWTMPWIKRREA